jgi:hypothetical protein
VKTLGAKDLAALRALCSADLAVELVGGAEADGFERNHAFCSHAHRVLPQLGFGEKPALDGVEGMNEVHRLEEIDGRIARIRCYCFCPDTLRTLGEHLGIVSLDCRYRSPG